MRTERLDGWKAIAAYLRLSVRQAQRLAKTAGLPVHHRGGTRAVYAETGELDLWIRSGDHSGEEHSPLETPDSQRQPRFHGAMSSDGVVAFPEPQPHEQPERRDIGRSMSGPVSVQSPSAGPRSLPAALLRWLLLFMVAGALLIGYQWWRTWSLARVS